MIVVPGPVGIYIGKSACKVPYSGSVVTGTLEMLGQTREGVQVSVNNKAHRIIVDDLGGQQGAPADLLALGTSATITGTVVDFGKPNEDIDSAAFSKMVWSLMSGYRVFGEDHQTEEGDVPAPGTPLFETGYGFSLYLASAISSESLLFPKCTLATNPRSWNQSSRETAMQLTFQAFEVPVQTTGTTGAYNARILYLKGTRATGTDTYQCRSAEHGQSSGSFATPSDDED